MINKVAVVGVGAVGGYFGGRLAARGYETTFVARGRTLQALQSRGLVVQSPLGDLALSPAQIRSCEHLEEVGRVDLVLLGVKTWQVAELAAKLAPLVAPGGVVLPLQNGIESPALLTRALGSEHVLGGLCRIIARQTAPAEISHLGGEPEILLGALAQEQPVVEARAQAIAQALASAGVRCRVRPDIATALWEKLAFIAAFASVGAATQAPIGELRSIPETRALLAVLLNEVAAVAAAHAVKLPSELVASTLSYFDKMPALATSSLQRDMAAGVPSELDALIGVIPRLGRAAGVATPCFEALHACLLPAELRVRSSAAQG